MRHTTDKVTITKRKNVNTLFCYINKNDAKALGTEITFNKKKLIIGKPHIDSKRIYSIKYGHFSFSVREDILDNYIGTYIIIKKDEDTFKLKKVKIS